MSEEIKNEVPAQEPTATVDSEVKTEATAEVTKPIEESTEELVNPLTGEVISPAKPKEKSSNSPYKQFKPETFVNPMTGEEEQTSIGSQERPRTCLLCRICIARRLEHRILLFAGHYHHVCC